MAPSHSLDTRVLRVAGAGLLVLAAIFGWREAELSPLVIAVALSGVAALVSVRRPDGASRWVIPLLLLATTGLSAACWLAFKTPLLLLGVAMPLGAAGVFAYRLFGSPLPIPPPPARELPSRVPEFATWQTISLGTLALTGGAYFHLLTLQVDDLGRRLVLTLVWTLLGLGAVAMGRKLNDTAPRDAGFVILAAAIAKATFYDTTHLHGGLRIGLLAATGVVLLVGSAVLQRLRSREAA